MASAWRLLGAQGWGGGCALLLSLDRTPVQSTKVGRRARFLFPSRSHGQILNNKNCLFELLCINIAASQARREVVEAKGCDCALRTLNYEVEMHIHALDVDILDIPLDVATNRTRFQQVASTVSGKLDEPMCIQSAISYFIWT